jgi:hypothetical protein
MYRDAKGRLVPMDDCWQQIIQVTDNSENLQNVDEEFFQRSKSMKRFTTHTLEDCDEISVEVTAVPPPTTPKEVVRVPHSTLLHRSVLTKITEIMEEYTEPDVLNQSRVEFIR